MFHETISGKQQLGWLIAGGAVPAVVLGSRSDWTVAGVAAAVGILLTIAVWKLRGTDTVTSKAIGIVQCLWLAYIAGRLAGYSSSFWPDGQKKTVVPLTLIFVGSLAAQRGGNRASKVGTVLMWIAAPMIGTVLLTGVKDVKAEWLSARWGNCEAMLIPVILTPCLLTYLPAYGGKSRISAAASVGAATVISAILIRGSMPEEMLQQRNPLLEYSKSIAILGSAKRMESVIACALTAGWFSLISVMLCTAGHIAEGIRTGWGRRSVWICGVLASAAVLLIDAEMTLTEAVACGVFWGLIPLAEGIEKKLKKNEE